MLGASVKVLKTCHGDLCLQHEINQHFPPSLTLASLFMSLISLILSFPSLLVSVAQLTLSNIPLSFWYASSRPRQSTPSAAIRLFISMT